MILEMEPECVPCLLKRVIYEARLVDPDKEREVVEESLEILNSLFKKGAVSSEVATEVHRRVYELLGTDDPYREMKRRSNEVAEKLLPRAREVVEKDGFRGACLVAVTGNVMDFGYRDDYDSPEYLTEMFEELLEEGFGYDDIDRIEELLKDSDKVVFLTDNCGEVVLDIPLLEQIKKHSVHLTVVVKESPILTDATMEDAEEYGIPGIADVVMTTGRFAVGVDTTDIPEGLDDVLKTADLIIAKGMANWESLSETDHKPIAYLTRSKCGPVARSMGVAEEINVAKLFE